MKMIWELLAWKAKNIALPNKVKESIKYDSLRKLVDKNFFSEIQTDNPAMEVLRKGR